MSDALEITPTADGVRFAIHVQPRSSHPGVDGVHGTALKVRVGAAPVDGAANDAVIEVLTDALNVSRRAVSIISGHTSRTKVVEVDGISPETVRELLNS
jgi:uncharacterized protein